ncbi:MAG: hypothetical protein IKP73_04060 [Bacteroidales bacterium]|jgi:flagellar biosynthesis/type III secretory pathway M-ring protein FliF/YscJ|nr:hypothetical protein [Bacteroidales bacterium]
MNPAAFWALMLIVFFAFIVGMIYAFRRNTDSKEKEKVETQPLNSFDDTLKSITTYSEAAQKEMEEKQKAEEEKKKQEEDAKDPLLKIETESRKKMMQDKNHIKKSAADEYFERTKNVANEILQQKK